MLMPFRSATATLPARSLNVHRAVWPAPSVETIASTMSSASRPDAASAATNRTTTSSLVHCPGWSVGGAASNGSASLSSLRRQGPPIPTILGGVASRLMVTLPVVVPPLVSAWHVSARPSVSVSSVIWKGWHPVCCAVAGITSQATVTSEVYHPSRPRSPVTMGATVGAGSATPSMRSHMRTYVSAELKSGSSSAVVIPTFSRSRKKSGTRPTCARPCVLKSNWRPPVACLAKEPPSGPLKGYRTTGPSLPSHPSDPNRGPVCCTKPLKSVEKATPG